MIRARHQKFVSAIRNPIEQLERRSLLAAISWDGGGNGTSWNDQNNWSNNLVPGASDDVTINVGANPNIVLTGDVANIRTLNLSENLSVIGTSLTVTDGTTVSAPMRVAGNGVFYVTSLTLNNILTLGDVDDSYGLIQFNGTAQTINGNGSINTAGANYAYVYNNTYNSGLGQGDTLTIGASIELNFGQYGRVSNLIASGTVVNNGQINAVGNGTSASDVTISNATTRIVNNGTMSFTNGARGYLYNFTNNAARTLTATDSLLHLYDDGATGFSWDNNGTMTINNTDLSLGGHFVFADVGTLNRTGGTVNIIGTLNNASSTLTLNNTTGTWNLAGNGRIVGGTVTATGANTLKPMSGTLDGVIVNIPLTVDAYQALYVENSITMNAALTLGSASDNGYGILQFNGPAAAINGSGSIGTAGTNYAYIYNNTYNTVAGTGDVLTIGNNIEVNLGAHSRIQNLIQGGTFINNGQIIITGNGTPSSDVSISNATTSFTNNGTITVTNGARVTTTNLLNNPGRTISVTNSEWTFGDDSNPAPFSWDNNGTLTSNNSKISFGGTFVFADIGTYNRTGGEVHLVGILDNTSATLTLNNTTGSWHLSSNGRILNGIVTATGANQLIPNHGTLDNVTLNTPVVVDMNRVLYVQNNLALNTTITLGSAVDNSYGVVQFNGPAMAINGTGSFECAGTNYAFFYNNTYNSELAQGDTLTITQNIELNLGAYVRVFSLITGGTILNNGQLNITGDGTTSSDFQISNGTTSFVNNGVVNITNSAIGTITNLVNNAGRNINVTNSQLGIYDDGQAGPLSWDNNGTIVYTNSHLRLGGYFIAADLGTLTRTSSELSIVGTLNNTSTTFTLSNALGDVNLATNGRILNGTVAGPSKLIGRSGTLDNVTLNAPTFIDQYHYIHVEHGLTLNSVLTMGGADNSYGVLQFNGASQTLGGTGSIAHLGTAQTYFYNATNDNGSGAALTIGSGIEIDAGLSTRIVSLSAGGTIINNGAITINGENNASVQLSELGNLGTNFINNGTISLTNNAGAYLSNLQGNTNTIGTSGLGTWLKINGVYTINTVMNIANRSTVFFDGTWTRNASLNISGTAIFEHGNDAGATFNAIKSAVISGYAGGAWNGNGLRDPVAASTPKYTLGYGASSVILGPTGGNFNGLFVDETATIVHHTLDADFNMDNTVNFTDLLKLAQSYGLSGKNFTDGDVDFNGSVNFNDLLPVAQLYGQYAFSSTPITTMLDRESTDARSTLK